MFLAELHKDLPSRHGNAAFGKIMHDLVDDIVVTRVNHSGHHDLKGVSSAASSGKPSLAPAQRPTRMLQRAFKRSANRSRIAWRNRAELQRLHSTFWLPFASSPLIADCERDARVPQGLGVTVVPGCTQTPAGMAAP